jgi:LysM repeat protein
VIRSFLAAIERRRYTESMHSLRSIALLVALLLAPNVVHAELRETELGANADSGKSRARRGIRHTVAAGETLSAIAAEHGTSVKTLTDLNPRLDPDKLRVGQELIIDDQRRIVHYTVRDGDTMAAIARRHGIGLETLTRANPDVKPERLRPGHKLRVTTALPASMSRSVGKPTQGELVNGRRLPRHPAYVLRDRERAWGTDEAVDAITAAFDKVRARHKRAPRVEVHDLSVRHGGWIRDHKSHQSGRDADLAFYQKRCARGVCPFRRLKPHDLDVATQWTLLRALIAQGNVEAIFIDRRLQKPLYEHARERGATREQLRRWFQYPGGPGTGAAIIRHVPKHDDHVHVRFTCHGSDAKCRSFRPLLNARASNP